MSGRRLLKGAGSLRTRIAVGVVGITSGVVLVATIGVWLIGHTFLLRDLDRELAGRVERMHRMERGPRFRPPEPPPGMRPDGKAQEGRAQFFDGRGGGGDPGLRGGPEGRPGDTARAIAKPETAKGDATKVDATKVDTAKIEAARTDSHEPKRYWRVINPDGTQFPEPAEGDPDFAAIAPAGLAPEQPVTVTLADGQHLRLMMARFPRGDGQATAWMAIEMRGMEEELTRLGAMLAGVWLTATVLALVATLLLRSTIIRPLRELDRAIDHLGPDDLAARLPATAGPAEVRGTVLKLNQLLDRLEQAFRREQTTIANIAHELRTPVAALRTTIEFRRIAATDPDERTTLDDAFRTIGRMQHLVSDLLLLARLEAGKEPLQREPVDVIDLTLDALDAWEPRAEAQGLRIAHGLTGTLLASTSSEHLRLVIGNLVGNAVQHSAAHGTISVTLDGRTLSIANPLAAQLDISQLGRPFYRSDEARSDGDHCGLGLALCRRLADLLGVRLELIAADGRFTARITLPE